MLLGVLFISTGCATSTAKSSRAPAGKVQQQQQGQQTATETPVSPVEIGDVKLDDLTYFTTPEDEHKTFIDAINASKENIFMEMFHLTDKAVVDALMAKPDVVKITLILDPKNASQSDGKTFADQLATHKNINVVKGSSKFTITHSKAMIIDYGTPSATAYVTSINLTNAVKRTRDYGVSTHDQEVINNLYTLFTADIVNANSTPQGAAPDKFDSKNIIVAPIPDSAKGKLLGLLKMTAEAMTGPNVEDFPGISGQPTNRDQRYVFSTVENLVDTDIIAAFEEVASKGVQVEIIVPQCDENPNRALNYPPLVAMLNKDVGPSGKKILGKMMPGVGTPQFPYMHGKMIVLSDGTAYIGSENFSFSSLMKSRETGIIFKNSEIAKKLIDTFNADWKIAASPAPCPGAQQPTPPVKKKSRFLFWKKNKPAPNPQPQN